MAEGLNDFEVTYSDGGRIIATDKFSFPVTVRTRYEGRYPTCRIENDCRPIPPNGGVYCMPRTVCSCTPN